jgi:hypothetical protein
MRIHKSKLKKLDMAVTARNMSDLLQKWLAKGRLDQASEVWVGYWGRDTGHRLDMNVDSSPREFQAKDVLAELAGLISAGEGDSNWAVRGAGGEVDGVMGIWCHQHNNRQLLLVVLV